MRKSFEELIDRAYDIKVYFGLHSYELHHYEDGSYIDFRVNKVKDLPTLLKLAGSLELNLFHDESYILVRLYENYYE